MSIQGAFLLILVLAIAVFDVAIIIMKGKKASISSWVIRTSYKYPSLVMVSGLAIGYVLGHTTWWMKPLDIYECNAPEIQEIINTCEEIR